MSEASEIAANMINRAGAAPELASHDEARKWIVDQWADWREWISGQMLDNIADSVLTQSKVTK